jgi:hypothetical protein
MVLKVGEHDFDLSGVQNSTSPPIHNPKSAQRIYVHCRSQRRTEKIVSSFYTSNKPGK